MYIQNALNNLSNPRESKLINIKLLTDDDYERARKKIEDILIEFRDDHISLPMRNNGLVVKEYDGTSSSVIRLGIVDALKIGLEELANGECK
jgi:hypothetical protein